jgi:uncharacterized protein YndB with AHSA1/START domain
MQRLNYSITIDAPREKVWHTMLDDTTYREWAAMFAPGSHYVGDWSEGSKILFLGPGESGEGGVSSSVRVSRPYEYVSLEHRGLVVNGEEDLESEAAKEWAGFQENYTFKDLGGKTELLVELDTDDENKDMFEAQWPKALEVLKALAEK